MNDFTITAAKYCQSHNENDTIEATIDGVEMIVPMDTANRHYAAILEWVAEGNTIEEAE